MQPNFGLLQVDITMIRRKLYSQYIDLAQQLTTKACCQILIVSSALLEAQFHTKTKNKNG